MLPTLCVRRTAVQSVYHSLFVLACAHAAHCQRFTRRCAQACGFCSSTWTCMYGNASGPLPVLSETAAPLPCARTDNGSWWFGGGDGPRGICSHARGNQVLDPADTPPIPHELDILCQNGGQRNWGVDASSHAVDGNTFCDCPDGWGGVDCSQCMAVRVCLVLPPGVGMQSATPLTARRAHRMRCVRCPTPGAILRATTHCHRQAQAPARSSKRFHALAAGC